MFIKSQLILPKCRHTWNISPNISQHTRDNHSQDWAQLTVSNGVFHQCQKPHKVRISVEMGSIISQGCVTQTKYQEQTWYFLQQTKDTNPHFVLESNSVNENARILTTKTVHSCRKSPGLSEEQETITSNTVSLPVFVQPCPTGSRDLMITILSSSSPTWPYQPS